MAPFLVQTEFPDLSPDAAVPSAVKSQPLNTCFIMGGGLPHTISYGDEPWDCEVILSLSRGIRNKSTQEPSVSMIHVKESLFTCLVDSFHHPRTLGPICSV